jgi:uncharacterized protein (DUF2384 family)
MAEEAKMAIRKKAIPLSVRSAELSQPPNLADPKTRGRLTPAATEAIMRLSSIWKLTGAETCALMGGMSERSFARLKARTRSGALSQDELTRVSALTGIYKGLHLLFSDPLADQWPKLPNAGPLFNGATPINAMITGGIPAIIASRRYIDALRGGL